MNTHFPNRRCRKLRNTFAKAVVLAVAGGLSGLYGSLPVPEDSDMLILPAQDTVAIEGASYVTDVRDKSGTTLVSKRFLRGDACDDGYVDIADGIWIINWLLADGPSPSCLDAADANDDGRIDLGDANAVLGYVFAGAGPLPAPFDECGIDETYDKLDCQSFASCER